MPSNNEEFLKKLRATFKIEAQEHISSLSSGLMALEKSQTAEELTGVVETVFREAHSLKGAARAVNMVGIETLCQSLESVFSVFKRGEMELSPPLLDLLHDAVDYLEILLNSAEEISGIEEKSLYNELLRELNEASGENGVSTGQGDTGEVIEQATSESEPEPVRPVVDEKLVTDTVRVTTTKLTSILFQAEEMLSAKLDSGQRLSELQELNRMFSAWGKEWSGINPFVQKLRHSFELNSERIPGGLSRSKRTNKDKTQPYHEDSPRLAAGSFQLIKTHTDEDNNEPELERIIEFLAWNHSHLVKMEHSFKDLLRSTEADYHALDGMVTGLLESSKKVLMTPLSTLLEIFPKLIRDLSRDRGKNVKVSISGGEIEVDRRILEEMKDPLIHLVRNCIDHGIEEPAERNRRKKPPSGEINIEVTQKDNHLEILVSDDGAGIDTAKIRETAVKKGLISRERAESMEESEILALVFQSGVSTSPIITDLSGRGLGLAIVREKTEKLGGSISFESKPGQGTVFRVVLPLTIATFRGVIVRLGDQLFVIPDTNVERVVRVNREEIRTVENRETIELDGRAVSLVRLWEVLGIPEKTDNADSTSSQAVVLAHDDKRIAFLVTEIVNEQEILVKNLGKQLLRVRNISGAAVIGTGRVIPIINVSDIVKSAGMFGRGSDAGEIVPRTKKEKKQISVLVVEDSITARALLKNILEAAGYRVSSAMDGVDGLTQLRTEQFDIVVSDVDMPRMNGFNLTRSIRSDKKLADIPVVLVTALASREDKERGVEAGANAYIVKSRFDQSNLLETITRLV